MPKRRYKDARAEGPISECGGRSVQPSTSMKSRKREHGWNRGRTEKLHNIFQEDLPGRWLDAKETVRHWDGRTTVSVKLVRGRKAQKSTGFTIARTFFKVLVFFAATS